MPAVAAGVAELDARKRVVLVDASVDARKKREVGIVPNAHLDIRGNIGRMMDFRHLGAHDRPAAFRLHAAHRRHGGGVAITHAVTVRHLIKAIAGGDGSDADRLEEDVVTGIAAHAALLSISRTLSNRLGLRR